MNARFVSNRSVARRVVVGLAAAVVASPALFGETLFGPFAWAQESESGGLVRPEDSYILPPGPVRELFGRDKNVTVLDNLGPAGDRFVVPLYKELSTLERMSAVTYRLAGLEMRPRVDRLWHLDTFGIDGLRLYSLAERSFHEVELPDDIFVSDMTWSPDGSQIAFLAHLDDGTYVWTAEAATGSTSQLSDARVMATIGTQAQRRASYNSRMIQWTPQGSVITLLVPSDRGPEPERNRVPRSPIIRRTRDGETPNWTQQFLLRDENDAALFRYYTRSQVAELAPGRAPRAIGEPGIYESIALSPGGDYLLTERLEEPFSYLVGYRSFARKVEILDRQGTVLATVRERPLREGRTFGRDPDRDLPREIDWRPDGAGLGFLQLVPKEGAEEAEEAEEVEEEETRDDRIMLLEPPFDGEAGVVASSEEPLSDVAYDSEGRFAFVTVSDEGRRTFAVYDLAQADPQRAVIVDSYDPDDPTDLPGDLVTRDNANGIAAAVVSSDSAAVFLQGAGYQEDLKPQPFVDRVSIGGGDLERLFEGSKDSYERPLVPLDDDFERMIVSRESKTDFPDSYLWSRDGFGDNLTSNADPFPDISATRRLDFSFTRRDGLKIEAGMSLPIDYQEGTRVPAIFWTYPREYDTAEEYRNSAIRSWNHNAFRHLSYLRWSDIWLTQGYAVVYPDIPIIGDPYNDKYIQHLVDSMYGAIRAVDQMGHIDIDRIGHGGHSYGAFATANILANTPFFKAGIAGDGAFNRTLTPMGFQSERRKLWEAPHVYLEMSPFFKADHIDTPLLMYHGADDNNSGTWPIQSERLIQALTGLGKTAVLYMYPYESHGPRALETNLDMWARWLDWFDRYVKGHDPEARETGSGSQEKLP